MPEVVLVVRNPSGLHARPAAEFVRAAARLDRPVLVANLSRDPTRIVDARSILGVLSLGVSCGQEIRLAADGEGAADALDELQALNEAGLGERVESAGAAPGR